MTKRFVMENRLGELPKYIRTGESRMQTFDQHILEIFHQKKISGTEALRWASNPEALAMEMRGIKIIGA